MTNVLRYVTIHEILFYFQNSISSLFFFKILPSRIERYESLSKFERERDLFDRIVHFLLRYLLARSNAKKWNEINADNCRQQLAGVPACRPTSLTGLRVARVSRRIVSTAIHFVPSYNPGNCPRGRPSRSARNKPRMHARVSRMMTNRNE